MATTTPADMSDQLSRALAARDAEIRSLTARQAAGNEVLKAISASPDDPQPVFELIARRARELCDAQSVVVLEYDGALLHIRAIDGYDPAAATGLRRAFPRPAGPEAIVGRAVLAGRSLQISDVSVEPGIFQQGRDLGARSCVAVPLRREGRVIGTIFLSRFEVRNFDDGQVALVESFAEQAVIAIASATALRELRARTGDLQEALERQTATAEVLQVINASPGDLRPVFDIMLERAIRLCGANFGHMMTYDGTRFRTDASRGLAGPASVTIVPEPGSVLDRVANGDRVVQILDLVDADGYRNGIPSRVLLADKYGARTVLWVALRRDEAVLGVFVIYRQEVRAFSDKQIALLENFAAQAVIAMENARLLGELQARTDELAARNSAFSEQIEHQSATIDVLKAMSASPGDPQPVFDLIVRRALELCNGAGVALFKYDGALIHFGAIIGHDSYSTPEATNAYLRQYPMAPTRASLMHRAILDRRIIHVRDVSAEPEISQSVRNFGHKSQLSLPLLHDGIALGVISLNGTETGGFSGTQVELLKTFAEQAVIAIRSAETFRELQARTAALAERNREFGEQVEHQAATIDVLKVMSASTNDTRPVFNIIVRRAMQLCNSSMGVLLEYDGTLAHLRAIDGASPEAIAANRSAFPAPLSREYIILQAMLDRQTKHVRNVHAEPGLSEAARAVGEKSLLAVPLLRDGIPIGVIAIAHMEPDAFTEVHVELLKTFAEQAVIAIGSVATFRELQDRTAELTRSVAELQALEEVLRAVNSSLDLETVLATIINRAVPLAQADEGMIYEFDAAEKVFVPKAAFGMTEDRIARLRERRIRIGETYLGRSALGRVPVHIADVQQDPSIEGVADVLQGIHAVLAVPLLREGRVVGGLVIRRRSEGAFQPATVTLMQTFAAQCVLAIENARLFETARRARAAAEVALTDLRRAQDRLVQAEKMASLGQLTAGIAHEIKNPLNFVNNFSDLSGELLDELLEALGPDAHLRAEIDDLATTLKANLQKIAEHGKRADGIVKNMLLHSRSGPVESRPVDLDAICEEALNLAYHGARANTPGFNITVEKNFDPASGTVELFPQDFTRALLNLIGNGFYAATKRAERVGAGFEPTLRLSTRDLGEAVEIRVRDNGTGIGADIREKIFDPFFTTKPAGEGTGLGLSLTFDIVVKQHGGQLRVDSEVDGFAEFVVVLPRSAPGGRQA